MSDSHPLFGSIDFFNAHLKSNIFLIQRIAGFSYFSIGTFITGRWPEKSLVILPKSLLIPVQTSARIPQLIRKSPVHG